MEIMHYAADGSIGIVCSSIAKKGVAHDAIDPKDFGDTSRLAASVQASRDSKDYDAVDECLAKIARFNMRCMRGADWTCVFEGYWAAPPNFSPDSPEWEPAPDWYNPVDHRQVDPFPSITKWPGRGVIIDQAFGVQNPDAWSVRVFPSKDHGCLPSIPEDAPKAVKAPYLATNQLALIRADSAALSVSLWERQISAWQRYKDNKAAQEMHLIAQEADVSFVVHDNAHRC